MITKNICIKTAGYLISFAFLYLTFKDTDFEKAFTYLNINNYFYLIAGIGFNICFFIVRGIYQINNMQYICNKITFSESLTSIGMAQFYNVIFPARMGELFRTYFLSKLHGIKKATVLSYILVEKGIDLLLILALMIVIIVFLIQGDFELLSTLAYLSGILFLMIAILLLYLRFNQNMILILKRVIPTGMFSTLDTINDEIMAGLKFFESKGQIAKSFLMLILSWVCVLAVFGMISYPYVVLLNLPLYSCLVFMVFSALSLSIPSAPAGIGVVHYGLYLAVSLLRENVIDNQVDIIAAFVISTHFFVMLIDVLSGGGIAVWYQLKFK